MGPMNGLYNFILIIIVLSLILSPIVFGIGLFVYNQPWFNLFSWSIPISLTTIYCAIRNYEMGM